MCIHAKTIWFARPATKVNSMQMIVRNVALHALAQTHRTVNQLGRGNIHVRVHTIQLYSWLLLFGLVHHT